MKATKIFLLFAALVVGGIVGSLAGVDPVHAAAGTAGAVYVIGNFDNVKAIGLGTYLTPAQIEAEATRLSHFNGKKSGMSFYDGGGDDLLSFTGDIRSFAQELDKNLDKQFTVSITNVNAANRTARLYAGYFIGNSTLAPGQLVQGAFNDVNAAAGLSGNTEEAKSIAELMLFLNTCPTRLLAMKIDSNVQAQLNQNLVYQRNNPFFDEPSKIIRPKNFINQDTVTPTQVTYPVDIQLDQLATFKMTFVGTSASYVTFFFGASLNIAYALEKKAARARVNVEAVGADNVVAAYKGIKRIG
ncbi:MAG TPA: hypothetical protein PJ995_21585 [Cyclobacteriaceae bacterium]|nr:hypothetical protein [Cyclobacteriaceae bacterium]HMX02944.1 hypothetical protein [Cyclobacteriaceae bacterium]